MYETGYDWTDYDGIARVTSNECKWVRRLLKYAEQYPDDVRVLRTPEENNGYLLVAVPKDWACVRPPRKYNLTQEQKDERAERMRKLHAQ